MSYTEQDNISFPKLMNILHSIYKSDQTDKTEIWVYHETWQDDDWFEEICMEDGGIIPEHLILMKTSYNNVKIYTMEALNIFLHEYEKIPYMHSKNGNYKFFYDVYILFNRHSVVYNFYLEKCYIRKLNFLSYFVPFWGPKWKEEYQLKLEFNGEMTDKTKGKET